MKRRHLSTEFGRLMKSAMVGRASTYILLREDDMIYLLSRKDSKEIFMANIRKILSSTKNYHQEKICNLDL
jgi:hypothetical protein